MNFRQGASPDEPPEVLITCELLTFLLEKASAHDRLIYQRAMKGALAQKRAAADRARRWAGVAAQLISQRETPFHSYRELAGQVAAQCRDEGAFEAIRKALARSKVLDKSG